MVCAKQEDANTVNSKTKKELILTFMIKSAGNLPCLQLEGMRTFLFLMF
jgi:hypothetical protein